MRKRRKSVFLKSIQYFCSPTIGLYASNMSQQNHGFFTGIWRIINTIASIWRKNILLYSPWIFFKLSFSLEPRSRKTVCISEKVRSADKYLCIFSHQIEAIVLYLSLLPSVLEQLKRNSQREVSATLKSNSKPNFMVNSAEWFYKKLSVLASGLCLYGLGFWYANNLSDNARRLWWRE